jgi:glycosyltransferase involved in cell wall biosynthesis
MLPTTTPEISVIIPVYNENESLPILYERLVMALNGVGKSWEIVFVDDGSTDGTSQTLIKLQEQDAHVIVVAQRRNFGKSLALSAGFEVARGEILITMDGDLQDEPAEIPILLAKLNEGYDVVTGWKKERQDPLSKRIPSRIANRTTAIMTGLNLNDMNSGFKIYRRDCIQRITLYGDLHRYVPVLAHYAGFRVTEVPVVHHKRQFGKSKYGVGRLIRGGLDLLTVLFLNQYSRRPLHLFGSTGAVLLLVGFMINLSLTLEWLAGARNLSDRPLLTLGVLLMLMGIQLLTMGLLAELLVSYIQRNEHPLNTVARIYRAEEPISESASEIA